MSDRVRVVSSLVVAAVAGLSAGAAQAVDESYATTANLIDRVSRLEQRLSGPALAEMVGSSEELRSELRSMRGELEELSHDIEELKQQQRQQYMDLDSRIQALSGGGGGAAPAAKAPTAPAAPTAGEPAPPAPASAADEEAARQAYQKAFSSLKEGRYKEAIGLFKGFLASHPGAENADGAQYWLGESYYVTRDFNSAREAFRKVIDAYPKSPKAADALLRLGYIEYDSQKWAAAGQILNDVFKRYPDSNAAQQAQARLKQMKQEGH